MLGQRIADDWGLDRSYKVSLPFRRAPRDVLEFTRNPKVVSGGGTNTRTRHLCRMVQNDTPPCRFSDSDEGNASQPSETNSRRPGNASRTRLTRMSFTESENKSA